MDLSIVIVSYNTKELLRDCLQSIKKASGNLKVETFVVDNASHDGTPELVEKEFPWVKLTASKINMGFSKGNNVALKKAKGKYILILNPDTRVMPDTFTKMITFMQENPKVGMATCKVEFPSGKLDVDCRRHFPTPWRAFTYFSGLSKLFPKSKIFDQYNYGYISPDQQLSVDACVGAFMFVDKKALDKVGLFDEEFFFYGEDLDLCWRFRENGYEIVYTPITKIIHYKGASSGIKKSSQEVTKATIESKKRVMKESVRAMRIFYRKHFKSKYPFFINWLMSLSMWLMEKYRLSKV